MKKRNIDREKEERERGRVYDGELWEVCVINEGDWVKKKKCTGLYMKQKRTELV